MNRTFLNLLTLTVALQAAAGCGASLKHASDVSGLFTAPPKTVGDLAGDICTTLTSRSSAPTLQNLRLDLGGCTKSGASALNLNDVSQFKFTDLPGQTAAAESTKDVFSKAIQTQIFLNRSLPELIPLFSKALAGGGGLKPGVIPLPESATKQIGNLVKPVITLTEAPSIDINNLTFSAKLNVAMPGVVTINIDVLINGIVLRNGIAVTISTSKPDPDYSRSFIKSFDVVTLVIPYANDVYIEMDVGMSIYNIGISALLDSQINTVFGSALKSMMDTLIKTGQGGSP